MPQRFKAFHGTRWSLGAATVMAALLVAACGGPSGQGASTAAASGGAPMTGAFDLVTGLAGPVRFSKDGKPDQEPPFRMTIGYGSAAFHDPGDPDDIVYTMSDRGPNLKCKDSSAAPVGIPDFCGARERSGHAVVDNAGKIFPAPSFDPSIYKIKLPTRHGPQAPVVLQVIRLKDRAGQPVLGLPNDLPDRPRNLAVATPDAPVVSNTEPAYGPDGARLPFDQSSLDPESLARLADGSFWIGEENAPSLVHVAADGSVLERVVPDDDKVLNPVTGRSMSVCAALRHGTSATAAANYPVVCALPGILDLRALNRGFENLAVSADGRTLYFGLQSPLANPSPRTAKHSRNVRLFTAALNADGGFGRVTGEYVYVLAAPEACKHNPDARQYDVKLSEMSVSPNGHLIQLERCSRTTMLYHVDLSGASNLLGSRWDDRTTQPSLERQADLTAAGIVPAGKLRVFDTDSDAPKTIAKIEGMAFLDRDYLLLTNDNDFGISGKPSVFEVLKAAPQVAR